MDPFYGAPVVLAIPGDRAGGEPECNGSLVIGNMMLAAQALDVSSCWVHRARKEFKSLQGMEILRRLGVTDHYVGMGHCILGYSVEKCFLGDRFVVQASLPE